MAPMSDESKTKLLERLKAGRAKIKAAREEAKAKGLPDPKPRKARKPKTSDGALVDPAAAPAARETIPPIDGAPRDAVNQVSEAPVAPEPPKSTPIDVPNLPGEGKKVESKKKIVKDAEAEPVAKPVNGISSTGRPKEYDDNDMLMNQETGDNVISVQFPGQKKSIEKALKANKAQNDPINAKSNPDPPEKTVRMKKTHVPDIKAVEGRAPFSYSAVKKLLFQQ